MNFLIFENVTITLPDSYKKIFEEALKDARIRRQDMTKDQFISWSLRFYLDRFQRMQNGLLEVWMSPEEPELDCCTTIALEEWKEKKDNGER